MKYYIYISDDTLEMLYSQLPVPMRKMLAAELKIDFKVISATVKDRLPEESRYSLLKIFCKHLRENGLVGGIDTPKSYVSCALPMHLVTARAFRDFPCFFSGHTERTAIALGGSPKHLIGQPPLDEHSMGGRSNLLALSESLYRYFGLESDIKPGEDAAPHAVTGVRPSGVGPETLYSVVILDRDNTRRGYHTMEVEFMAKVLLHGRELKLKDQTLTSVLLGSPLYVAMGS